MDFSHFLWIISVGIVANERIGATKPIPEVVNLMRLLADERGGGSRTFALLQTFAKRLLFGGQGHCVTACGVVLRTVEWKLKEMLAKSRALQS